MKPLKRVRWRWKDYNSKLLLEKTAYSATTITECISDRQSVISIYRLLKTMKDAVIMTQNSEYEISWCELNSRKEIGASSRTTFNSQAGMKCTWAMLLSKLSLWSLKRRFRVWKSSFSKICWRFPLYTRAQVNSNMACFKLLMYYWVEYGVVAECDILSTSEYGPKGVEIERLRLNDYCHATPRELKHPTDNWRHPVFTTKKARLIGGWLLERSGGGGNKKKPLQGSQLNNWRELWSLKGCSSLANSCSHMFPMERVCTYLFSWWSCSLNTFEMEESSSPEIQSLVWTWNSRARLGIIPARWRAVEYNCLWFLPMVETAALKAIKSQLFKQLSIDFDLQGQSSNDALATTTVFTNSFSLVSTSLSRVSCSHFLSY